MEYKIPGFSKYTIDDDLVVRSYSSKDVRIMSNHGRYGCVRLLPDGGCRADKKDMPVTKIYFSAKAGINPALFNAQKCKLYIKDGQVLNREEYYESVKRKRYELNPHVENASEHIQWIGKAILTLERQKKALETGDWSEVVEDIWSYERELTCYLMKRYDTSRQNAEFVFKLSCDELIRRMTERGYSFYNIRTKLYAYSRIKFRENKNATITMKDFYERVAYKKQLLDL